MKKLTTLLFVCLAVLMVQAQVKKHPKDYLDLDKMVQDPEHPKGEKGETFTNPIVRADFPDPDVIRVGNTYYMVSTTMYHFPGATILKSQDLVNWEYCAQPLKQLLDDDRYNLRNGQNAYAKGMWASTMKWHDGKFWLLINGNDDRAWLLSAANPEGEWDVRRLSRNYYDPGMLFDGDRVYIACGYNRLSMCELDADFNFIREEEIIVRERSGLEGCHVYKIGDYYYIYSTYGGFPSGQTVFRSKNVFGPYEEKVLVEKRYGKDINTIHQGALLEDVAGQWWTVMQEDLGAFGRFPNLLPVTWEDGWPVVNGGKKPYVSFVDKNPGPASAGGKRVEPLPTTDDFSASALGMQWEWNHNPVASAWSLTERAGWLRLKTASITQQLHQAQGMLTQRIFADPDNTSNGTIRLDVSKLKEGDRAGICIFQDPYAMICVERTAKGYQLVWRQDMVRNGGKDFAPAEKTQTIKPKKGIVYLRAAIKFREDKARFYYSLDNKKWEAFGGETHQTFNLTVFVGSRFGIFCYATKQQGGYADFDWFIQ